jgi:protein TonB
VSQNLSLPDARAGNASSRLMRVCIPGSLLLHALLLGLLPGWHAGHEQPVSVLDVQLQAPSPQAAEAPAPRRDRAPARPETTQVRPQPHAETPPAPVIALDAAPATAADAPRVVQPPAAAAASTAAPSATPARAEPVTPPSFSAAYLRNPPPPYPAAARRSGEEGTVTLRVLVTVEGLPARIELERSSGSRLLDAAAIEAVRGWRFQPARRGSQAVEDWALVPLRFRLDP